MLEDLAQSARAELELRAELEARCSACAACSRHAPVAISANDLEGRSLLRNPAAEQLGGEQPLNVVEFPLTDLAGEAYGTGAIGVPEAQQRFVTRSTTRRPGWRWSAPTGASARSTPRSAS